MFTIGINLSKDLIVRVLINHTVEIPYLEITYVSFLILNLLILNKLGPQLNIQKCGFMKTFLLISYLNKI